MMIEIKFDEKKCLENRIDIGKCYKIMDSIFLKDGIEKLEDGVYKGDDSQNTFDVFAIGNSRVTNRSWFIKVVKEWYWRFDSDCIADREDCLQDFIDYHKKYYNIEY